MIYLLAGLGLMAVFVWLGRQVRRNRGAWRPAAAVLAAAAYVGAALVTLKGAWPLGLALTGLGVWLSISARARPAAAGQNGASGATNSEAQARAILGVSADASPEAIRAAHLRMMATVHPDRGGSAELAAQLNVARDRLLGRA